NVLRNLKRDPDNKDLFTKLDTLKPQLQSQDKAIIDKQSELKKLRKLTEGTIVSKIIKTGLMGIASPFISLFSTTLVAPVLPLFGGMALLDANAVAQTGKHLDGRPCIREHLQKKMQGMEE